METSNEQLAYTNTSVSIDVCKGMSNKTMLITANNGLYNNYIPLERDVCKENLDNCDQICIDTRTSYICSCNPGYMLHADGYSCTSE